MTSSPCSLDFEVRLKDALYNTHNASGASEEYGKGIVVGVVSALMANGMSFSVAHAAMYRALPDGYRKACIPTEWKVYLIVQHQDGRQYLLNRNYGLIGDYEQEPITGISVKGHVESWSNYSTLSRPDWTAKIPSEQFTGYWLW